MKILIAADTYYPNTDGASYFTQRLASLLSKRGHTVLVIAASRTNKTEYYTHDGVDIVGIFSIPSGFHKNYRFTLPFFIKHTIEKSFKKFAPDIVHIQGHFFIESTVALVAQKFHIPVLATNHFMPENLIHYLHAPEKIEKILTKIGWTQFCKVFETVDFITTPTQTAVELLKTIGLKKNAIPVSCGIDLQKFQPRIANESLRSKFGLPNTPLLLSVGRLAPEKNIDCILHAIAQIPPETQFHFALAGIGIEKDKLQKLVLALGIEKKVTFLGFVQDADLPALYNLATGFVNAGTAELQSIVVLEAMASGLPIIAANAIALPELVKNNENGYIFEPGNNKELAIHIQNLFSEPELQKKFSKNSLEKIQKHNIEKTLDTFEEIYHDLITNKDTVPS
jgi:1,2-diacylglycerol 3-alpha-glucosyltransferase